MFLVVYATTIAVLALATAAACRPGARPPVTVALPTAALVFTVGASPFYAALEHQQAELLVLAFIYIAVGTMVSLPWGAWPQAIVVAAALVAYGVATLAGVPAA